MAIEIVSDRDGHPWAIDWGLIDKIISGWATHTAMVESGQFTETSESDWYNPFSWQMPTVVQFETSFRATIDKVPKYVNKMKEVRKLVDDDPSQLPPLLFKLVSEKEKAVETLKMKSREASRKTMKNIAKSVDSYETSIKVSKTVRDVSGDVIIVGAGIATGGTATALAAGGSLFKASAKYQDTGSARAAVAEGSISLFTSFVPVRFAGASKYGTMIIVEAGLETANAYADGKDIKESLLRGGGKLIMGGLGKGIEKSIGNFFNGSLGQQLLQRTSVPMTVKIVEQQGKTIEKPMQELVSEGVKLFNTHVIAGPIIAHQIDQAVAPPKKDAIRNKLAAQKPGQLPSALNKATIARQIVLQAAERLVSLPQGY
ncbi:MAG: hypothetical protein ABJP70_06495 [Erythrobacter sp.]